MLFYLCSVLCSPDIILNQPLYLVLHGFLGFAFFVMLMARDLALVAAEGVLGLVGFIFLVPLYGIGLGICRAPNMLSYSVTEDPSLLVIDAVATPVLIFITCWIFGFFDSAQPVLEALFGI